VAVPGSFEKAAQGEAILELSERDPLAGIVMAREDAVGLQVQGLEDHAVHRHPSRRGYFIVIRAAQHVPLMPRASQPAAIANLKE
jgi:hypothetical protein